MVSSPATAGTPVGITGCRNGRGGNSRLWLTPKMLLHLIYEYGRLDRCRQLVPNSHHFPPQHAAQRGLLSHRQGMVCHLQQRPCWCEGEPAVAPGAAGVPVPASAPLLGSGSAAGFRRCSMPPASATIAGQYLHPSAPIIPNVSANRNQITRICQLHGQQNTFSTCLQFLGHFV